MYETYAKELAKHIGDLSVEKCYGCQFSRPSQTDHDICLMTPYSELLDLYITEAMSRLDKDAVNKIWYEKLQHFIKPSVTNP